jgi:hypothetical protein
MNSGRETIKEKKSSWEFTKTNFYENNSATVLSIPDEQQ